MEDRATESNLSFPGNENDDKEESNTPEEGKTEVPPKCSKKERN
jgi:hypothetical protein